MLLSCQSKCANYKTAKRRCIRLILAIKVQAVLFFLDWHKQHIGDSNACRDSEMFTLFWLTEEVKRKKILKDQVQPAEESITGLIKQEISHTVLI